MPLFRITNIFVLLFLALTLSQCDETNPFEMDYSDAPASFDISNATKVELADGLYIYDIEAGEGNICTERDIVRVHFTARVNGGRRVVASTFANQMTAPARIELSRNINVSLYAGFQTGDFSGLRRGMNGMLEGSKRTIIVPPTMGFGLSDTLKVDVELFDVIL